MADAVGREGNMSNLLALSLSTGSCKLVPYQTVQKTVSYRRHLTPSDLRTKW